MSTEYSTVKFLNGIGDIIALATENTVNELNTIINNKIQDIEDTIIPKDITDIVDFNSITESGIYSIDASASKTNVPSSNGGELIVLKSDLYIFQLYFTLGVQLYVRYNKTNVWSGWHYLSSIKKLYSTTTVISTQNNDLNSMYTYLAYSIENKAVQNLPIDEEGLLENNIGTKYYHQKYITLSGKVFVRHYTVSSKTWSLWTQI